MKKILFPVIILVLLFTTISCAPAATARVAPVSATSGYAHPEALLNTDWVAAHLNDPQVRLVDVSSKREVYDQGHLPGSVYINVTTDLLNPVNSENGKILSQAQFETLMRRLGIRRDIEIVLYDDSQSLYAARAFWVLKYFEHPNVAILNGGSQQWSQEKRAMTKDVPSFAATSYAAGGTALDIRTTWGSLLSHIQKPGIAIVDARSPQEFTGEQVRGARGGHIPGAINVEWSKAMKPDGTFRPADELVRLYQRADITRDKSVVTYCQTGVRGAHEWFVLKYLLGYESASLYDGSWEEWGSKSDLPISAEVAIPEATPTKQPDPCE